MTAKDAATITTLRALMDSSTYANEKANAYARILRITARSARSSEQVSVYARMGTTAAPVTFTAWL